MKAPSTHNTLFTASLSALGLALTACGGGSTSNTDTTSVPTVAQATSTRLSFSGTVAIGAAVAGSAVAVKCPDAQSTSNPTDASGQYAVSLVGNLPCTFEVALPSGLTLRSFSATQGVVNVTPLTQLGYQLADGLIANKPAATALLTTNLPKFGIELTADPFHAAFQANGTGMDKAIDQYVALANKTQLTSPGSTDKIAAFTNEWVAQCTNQSLCAPLQVAVPSAPASVSSADKSRWQKALEWSQARLSAIANRASSLVGTLATESNAVYVDGYLTEQSTAMNKAYQVSLAGGSAAYDGNWGEAGKALINNIWTSVDTGLEAADIKKIYRVVCYTYKHDKFQNGGYGASAEDVYASERELCDYGSEVINAALVVRDLKKSANVLVEQKSNIKNLLKHFADNAGGWRTRALNNGYRDYLKHLYGLSTASVLSNASYDAIQKASFLKDTFELFQDAAKGLGMTADEAKTFFAYQGETPPVVTPSPVPVKMAVTSFSPNLAQAGVAKVFTVTGTNLTAAAILAITDAECGAPYAYTSSSFSQVCTPRATGTQTLVVKTEANGVAVFNGSVNVTAPAIPMKISSVKLDKVELNKAITITVSGSNITNTAVLAIADAECAAPYGHTATGFYEVCTPLAAGSKQLVVKDQAGGTVVYSLMLDIKPLALPMQVSTVTPGNFTLNQPTTLMVTGSNIANTAVLTISDAECNSPYGHTITSFSQICTPRAAGSKTVMVKDQPSGNVLYTDVVNVAQPVQPMTVSFVSPGSFMLNQRSTLVVTGSNITGTAILAVEDAECEAPYGHSATGFNQDCTPRAAGSKALTVKDYSGGNSVYSTSVTVTQPASGMTVSWVSPSNFALNQATTVTISGNNITSSAVMTIADAECGSPYGHSSTMFYQVCRPRAAGTKTLTVKSQSGGSVVFTRPVSVR